MTFDVDAVLASNYHKFVYRIVETQENAATMMLVDNDLEKQAALEALLEEYKPIYRDDTLPKRHYLIATPFRYPPLKYGSRFGSIAERSYFYASETEETCLVEAAYYRFLFIKGKATIFNKPIMTEHDVFSVEVMSDNLADLTLIEDKSIQQKLTAPDNYSFTQQAGSVCRNASVDLIRFFSARHKNGINVAVDNHFSIMSEIPVNRFPVTIEVKQGANEVVIKREKQFPTTYPISMFSHEGIFPSILYPG